MPLGKKQIDHLAQLARLQLSPQEKDRLDQELGGVVDYFDQLKHVSTHGIQPRKALATTVSPLRKDVRAASLTTADALANAPQEDGEYFLVPRVIER